MTSLKTNTKYKIGLALGGGGARGFAHVGVLKALEEVGIKPDIIAGVSAGSVIAGLYASGRTPEEILDIFKDVHFNDLAELGVPKDGFFKIDRFKKFISKAIPVKNIEDLNIPTFICATDIDNSEAKVFSEGKIADRIAASCSIPIIFKPIKIDGIKYVDGGVLHNLPAWAIRPYCDILIGVNVSPLIEKSGKTKTIIDVAKRSYELMAKNNTIDDMAMCDVLIQTKGIANIGTFKIEHSRSLAISGYYEGIETLTNSKIINEYLNSKI